MLISGEIFSSRNNNLVSATKFDNVKDILAQLLILIRFLLSIIYCNFDCVNRCLLNYQYTSENISRLFMIMFRNMARIQLLFQGLFLFLHIGRTLWQCTFWKKYFCLIQKSISFFLTSNRTLSLKIESNYRNKAPLIALLS